ncbi:hypothetical protein [Goodfellowiella coeruleoviolacea]|uniref:Uncharacterized protein n=1 Tax=Goodfellowiella coeruleoviolacea TaxID=334858 RepID=A0AAE3GK63_9PSEU|nr:hypothetical protein [Goodfellowiella coeruleoviolacea]MCP2168854.1 hypothetical protein [Goodfellowiella coeruleoviolacea]
MSAHAIPATPALTAASCLTAATWLGTVLALAPAASASGDKLTHEEAVERLLDAGVTWNSTGGCTDRDNPACTSFDQVNSGTIDGVITLKEASGCPVNVSGGTEAGHSLANPHSHWAGYKLDLSKNPCLDNYIRGSFSYVGRRADGYGQWQALSGNLYCDEGNHWDVLYY